MYGAIAGDIVGSIYEFNNLKSKDFALFNEKSFFTDDTVCTVALTDALLNNTDPADTLRRWCMKYSKNGGWGQMFSKWIVTPNMGPYGSFGNGAAMRISAVGFIAQSIEELFFLSDRLTEITHNHPEGLKGARATCLVIYLTRRNHSMSEIRIQIENQFGYDLSKTVDEIRQGYFYNETCQQTVPQAITCFLNANSFEDALRNGISIGGDSDTIAAIIGGMAEAKWGLPSDVLVEVKKRIPLEMVEVMDRFYQQFVNFRT